MASVFPTNKDVIFSLTARTEQMNENVVRYSLKYLSDLSESELDTYLAQIGTGACQFSSATLPSLPSHMALFFDDVHR